MGTNYMTFVTLVLATVFWGANFNVGKFAVDNMSPLGVASWRFGIAAICMMALLYSRQKVKLTSVKNNLWTYVVMGAIGVFGFNACFFYGLKLTTPINGSLIMALNPMLTVLLSALLLKERITSRQVAGLLLSLCGVLIVVTHASLVSLLSLGFSAGDLIILAGNLCWALYSVIGKRFLKESPPMQTTAFSMSAGALMLIGLTAIQGDQISLLDQSAPIIASILFMAFFGSVLAYLWWNKAISEIGSARTAVFFDLVPITTMLISISFGASISPIQMFGSSLVLVGVAFSCGIGIPTFKLAGRTA